MSRIERLTPAQETRLQEVYEDWLRVGRSCEPIDLEAAKAVVTEMYRRIGEPEPVFLKFSSPAMCILAWGVLQQLHERDQLWGQLWGQLRGQLRDQLRGQLRDQLRGQLGDQLWGQLRDQLRDQLWGQLGDQLGDQLWGQLGDQLRDQLRDQLWGQLGDQLWGQLRDQLGDQLRDQLWDQLGDQLWDQLGDQLGDQLWGQLRDQLRDQLGNYFGGQHWIYWQAHYHFPIEIGVKYTEQQLDLLDLWVREGRALHWWFPYRGIVLLSERHSRLGVDEQGRLHSETGQAVGYPDGWGLWAWHGVIVPQQVIDSPETLTAPGVLEERNSEIRRVMMERFGQERLLRESGAELVDKDDDELGQPRVLWRLPVPDDEPLVMVELINSTPEPDGVHKHYFLRVPPEIETAQQAVAWTWGVEADEYVLAVQS